MPTAKDGWLKLKVGFRVIFELFYNQGVVL